MSRDGGMQGWSTKAYNEIGCDLWPQRGLYRTARFNIILWQFHFPRDSFGGCHRYDQSLQNILVSHAYNHEHEKYQYWSKDFAIMARG